MITKRRKVPLSSQIRFTTTRLNKNYKDLKGLNNQLDPSNIGRLDSERQLLDLVVHQNVKKIELTGDVLHIYTHPTCIYTHDRKYRTILGELRVSIDLSRIGTGYINDFTSALAVENLTRPFERFTGLNGVEQSVVSAHMVLTKGTYPGYIKVGKQNLLVTACWSGYARSLVDWYKRGDILGIFNTVLKFVGDYSAGYEQTAQFWFNPKNGIYPFEEKTRKGWKEISKAEANSVFKKYFGRY